MNETRKDNNYYSDGISLWELLHVMWRHAILIVVMAVVLAAGGFGLAKYVLTPQYTSSVQILVNQKHATADGQAYNNQQADIQMINTYKEIITNHQILSEVRHQLANPTKGGQPAYQLSYRKLKKMVNVQTSQNAQVFQVKVKSANARESATIANTVTSVFQKRIKKLMGFSNIKVASRAVAADKPSFPSVVLFTLGGAIIGFFLGTVIAVIKEV